MKTDKDFSNPTAYAKYLKEYFNLPKYMKPETIAKRYRKGERDINKLIAQPTPKTVSGKKGRKKSHLNPFLNEKIL